MELEDEGAVSDEVAVKIDEECVCLTTWCKRSGGRTLVATYNHYRKTYCSLWNIEGFLRKLLLGDLLRATNCCNIFDLWKGRNRFPKRFSSPQSDKVVWCSFPSER